MENLKAIRPPDLLKDAPEKEKQRFLALGTKKLVAKSEHVFSFGNRDHNIYLLCEGMVKIYQTSPLGREVIMWFCFPGELFGLRLLAQSEGSAVSAQASEDSEVLVVPGDSFKKFLFNHAEFAFLVLQAAYVRLQILGDMMVNLTTDDVRSRLAKFILRLGASQGVRVGSEIHLKIQLTHKDIADTVGTTRQTVTSILNEYKQQGILSIHNHFIHIESEELLGNVIQGKKANNNKIP